MKNIALIMLASIYAFGCTKNSSVQPQSAKPAADIAHININDTVGAEASMRIGGDDQDTPIIMDIIRNVGGRPIGNVTVTLINGTDTITRHTNIFGDCVVNLPRTGVWDLTITHAGYQTIHTVVYLHRSYNIRFDRLIAD